MKFKTLAFLGVVFMLLACSPTVNALGTAIMAIQGSVFMPDGSLAPNSLPVTVTNTTRNLSSNSKTGDNGDGKYIVSFIDFAQKNVAATGDEIVVVVTYEGFEYSKTDQLTDADIRENKADIDINVSDIPQLEITLTMTLPNGDEKPVNVGQDIIFTMTVKNKGQAMVEDVKPSIEPSALISHISTDPVSATLAPVAEKTFSLRYEAISPADNVTFSGKAIGKDFNSKNPVGSGPVSSQSVTIEHPAELSIESAETDGDKIIEGQNFTLTVVVKNTGGAAAEDVKPYIVRKSGEVDATFSNLNPPSATIEGGGKKTYTWNGIAEKAGNLALDINVQGTDANSGKTPPLDEDFQASIPIDLLPHAKLSIESAEADSSKIIEGQSFTLTVVVKNTGGAAAKDVKPIVRKSGEGDATFSNLNPTSATIEGGGKKTYTWNGIAEKAGNLALDINVQGTDANSGEILSLDKDFQKNIIIDLLPHAKLSIVSIETDKSKIIEGQSFTLTVVVENEGGAAAKDVIPSIVRKSGEGDAIFSNLRLPSATIGHGGKPIFFTFDGIAEKAGNLTLYINVQGTDANSGETVSLDEDFQKNITIIPQPPPPWCLSIVPPITTDRPEIIEGQHFTLAVDVKNICEVAVKDVKPSIVRKTGEGNAIFSNLTPPSATISGGGKRTYTWDGIAEKAGDLTLYINVQVTDASTEEILSFFGGDVLYPIDIKKTPELTIIDLEVKAESPNNPIPNQISEGQRIIVTMAIKNKKDAGKAYEVTPSITTTTGADVYKISFYPDSIDIAGGWKDTFECKYGSRKGSAGTVGFTLSAEGKDNIDNTVSVKESKIGEITIQTPANLKIIQLSAPHPGGEGQISEGQNITLEIVVENTGQATAQNVHINADKWGLKSVSLTPDKIDIPGGKKRTFTWIWTIDQGTKDFDGSMEKLYFEVTALGTDFNSGENIQSPSFPSNDIVFIDETGKTGDLNGDGRVTAYDAILILQYVTGLIKRFPVDEIILSSAQRGEAAFHNYVVKVSEQTAKAGDRIFVPIVIDDATGLLAGAISLKYDPTILKAVDVAQKMLLLGGVYSKANISQKGEVRFAFATTQPMKGHGNLLLVEFEVLSNTEGKTSPLILDSVNLSNSLSVTKINGSVMVLPSKFALLQNYPNPFNPETWIPYQLAQDVPVTISIYNKRGQLVHIIYSGTKQAGIYVTKDKSAYWDGKNSLGQSVASDIYYYTLETGEFRATRKMVITK